METPRRVEIGRLGKTYGLEGALKFRGEPVVLELRRVYLEGLGYRAIREARTLNREIVLYLAGVGSLEAAQALVGLRVYADVSELPKLEEGTYYYFELVGQPVYVDGQPFGEVVDIQEGPQDLLVIRARGRSLRAQHKTYLVPLQAPYVRLEPEGIHIEAIPGLLE
ncbi:MAG: ribosome maturation factor RimM [Meiothermus sp.]|uniref:ribosome maturation factor RimM n=1 Tax=Meiothermus sp. TaxID=1955249 RepID=UPI0025FA93E8|nr:ribosome maturation factor RimM [Meiothermus sp.]MCS7057270.1 ribosome maturation factor RimM [Meiothermus sp.]MCS7193638.1 ribosome maturation factor RimM [Meiothermus sp.]MCX7740404.1 ribosome maturation factor RimM [Meiothermus sp.]MDW8091437.1 ribosome maturation factor RimM [Meiothermus sp.]